MNAAESPPPPIPPAADPAPAPPAAGGLPAVLKVVLIFLAVAVLGLAIFYFAEQAWLRSWSRQTEAVPALPPPMGALAL